MWKNNEDIWHLLARFIVRFRFVLMWKNNWPRLFVSELASSLAARGRVATKRRHGD